MNVRFSFIAFLLTLGLLLIPFDAWAYKTSYDKASGVTTYESKEGIASFGYLSNTYILYRMISVQSADKKQLKAALSFRSLNASTVFDPTTPLYLLFDGKERHQLEPIGVKAFEPGGTGAYLGWGVSTYKRTVYEYVSYELSPSLLQKILNAERIDASLAGRQFVIKGYTLKQLKELAAFTINRQIEVAASNQNQGIDQKVSP